MSAGVHLTRLALTDFRSYAAADVTLEPGVTTFTGSNGQGKTNLVEAACYVATFASHRVATDAPLIRQGAERAILRAGIRSAGRDNLVEIEINAGRANRVRLNRAPAPRPREVIGVLQCVLFAPEDLSVVKGDPEQRRRYLDDLLVASRPRYAGVRADYERVLRQRNALLKSAKARGGVPPSAMEVWDDHLVTVGAELTAARLRLVAEIEPLLARCYSAVSGTERDTTVRYVISATRQAGAGDRGGTRPDPAWLDLPRLDSAVVDPALDPSQPALAQSGSARSGSAKSGSAKPAFVQPDQSALAALLREALATRRRAELERGVSLVGPHRDELELQIGGLPARGYASHGESWSLALALRLAAYQLLRSTGEDPVLVLDDVFAELDSERRERLADLVRDADQVLVTAAVPQDVPEGLSGIRYEVAGSVITSA
jgi:DNA replication and repair protein RecF